VDEARRYLHDLGDRGIPVAGGTALHFLIDERPVTAVDITRMGLDGIQDMDGGYRIGATTPLADIQAYRAERWAFHEVCRGLATHQVRNISTLGGNICRVFPWADLPVALLALNADMLIRGDKEIVMPCDEYFSSQPARLFKNGDLLVAVQVPALGPHMGFGYHKEVRTAKGFSMMTAAAVLTLDGDTIEQARVAAGGAAPFPCRLPDVEAALQGQAAETKTFQQAVPAGIDKINWKGREGLTDEYARHLAEVVVCDVLERAKTFARERT
jgi:CO/xanthine dehydrogenase FAD-binding subunit